MLMLLRLKTLLKSLILPPAGPLLLAFVGVFLLNRRPRLGRACIITGVGFLWIISTPVVAVAIARWAEHYPALDLRIATGAQAIVILGGGGQRPFAPEYGGPAADPQLLERLTYGAYVAKKTGLPILVTGFHTEAIAMRETLKRNFEIAPRWVDDQAYDTFQNAQNSVGMLKAEGIHRIVLVTRAPHMWRAVHEFTAAGIEVVPAPEEMLRDNEPDIARYTPSPYGLDMACSAINELLGEPVRAFLAAVHARSH
jgi:uncharacterized SAM-binding protein YcdF (DUF218 family)